MVTAKKVFVVAKAAKQTAPVAPTSPVIAPVAKSAPVAAKAVGAPAKPAPTATAATSTGTAKPATPKPDKEKKPKLVRDSFAIPKAEYMVLDDLKKRSAGLASPMKKSQLLRAGIKALAAMPNAALLAALKAVPAIKTGRPSKS